MKVDSIKFNMQQRQEHTRLSHNLNANHVMLSADSQNKICFKGNLKQKAWLLFRKLSNYMKEPSEMTNAEIAAIGTGAIAPFAIMCSPKKKNKNATDEDKKVEREKKFFQALRQPVSAFLAFAFQVPTTIGIAMGLNHLAYKKHMDIFKDKILGDLIPDKKYLKNQAKAVLKNVASTKTKEDWAEELKVIADKDAMKKELMQQLKQDYEEVGMTISDKELERLAEKKNKKTNFLAEKMADAKHKHYIDDKVKELSSKDIKITDLDLVTEDYQNLAKERYKTDFKELKNKHKLSWFDTFIKSMGISNKRIGALNDAEKALAQEKGLEIIKQEVKNKKLPDVFNDKTARLRKFIENRNVKAQKLYSNKIFWITLLTNLFMVAISCVALNWLHPKFADGVDKIKQHRAEKNSAKKAEVVA